MLALRVSLAVAAMMFRADALAAETARCTLPNAGDWREYRSKHFIVDTDVSRSTAGRLVDDLERIHALELKALVGEVVDIPGHIRVIAFGRPRDFETVSSHKNAGSYSAFTSLGEPTIVLPVERLSADPENVAFQVANRISPFLFPRQPPWFRIGLAMFVQTVATDTDL